MSIWMAASITLMACLLPCTLACLRRDVPAALAALNVASVLAVLLLITLSVEFNRQSFVDLAVVLAPMSVGGCLAFVRYLERRR